MTDREILFRVVLKANENGYKEFYVQDWHEEKDYGLREEFNTLVYRYNADTEDFVTLFDIIFSHEFAKAFWGEEEIREGYHIDCSQWLGWTKNWMFHLSHMVLEEEPLKYLEKFLK